MMTEQEVRYAYFEWLVDTVCENEGQSRRHYRRLLKHLHDTTFIFSNPLDSNRAEDGVNLRYRFGRIYSYSYEIIDSCFESQECSILEMMVALSVKCEEHIMGDPEIGDRTGMWFWGMIFNLELEQMSDNSYNAKYVDEVIHRLLYREYDRNGSGGLFTVNHRSEDMRDTDIWYQMCWHLEEILD